MDLFFFGTLRHAPLLNIVLGRDVFASPSVLPGWHAERAAGGDFPLLVPGGQARGVLVRDLSPTDLARLRHYEGGFDYDVRPVAVQAEGDTVTAQAFFAGDVVSSGTPWSLADWITHHAPMTLEAAPEFMRAFERGETPETLKHRFGVIRARAAAIARARTHHRPVTVGQGVGADQIEIIARDIPYERFFRVEEYRLTHPRHDGTRSGVMERAIYNVCDAVTVLPWDPVRDRVLVVEQMRLGALAKGDPLPWLLEPIAGMLDAGEDEATCALREAEEEARLSLDPGALHHVSRYYPSPGGVAQILSSYVALADLPDQAAGLGGALAEGEDIRAHLVSFDHLMAMVASGEACNAPLVMSAQWIALNRDRLRAS